MRLALFAAALSAATCIVLACSSSSSSPSQDPCTPDAGSCDVSKKAPFQMQEYDVARSCVRAPAALPDICITSVNTCGPSAGLVVACAFAPDGRVFGAGTSDNLVPTAAGWHFSLPRSSYPVVFPSDQVATAAEDATCAKVACAPGCAGATALPQYSFCGDAGDGSDAASDAVAD